MESPKQKKSKADARERNTQAKWQLELQKKVQILWSKLNDKISQPLALATQETNQAFHYKEQNIKELKLFATGSSLSSYSLYFLVGVAAVVDVFLWRSTFQSVEGVDITIANAVGLTVAIFAALGAAIIGRAIKQKSTHESFHAEYEQGVSRYDKFTSFQNTIFEKNTAHNYLKWGGAAVLTACILIPFTRWVGYDNKDLTNPTDGRLEATLILTGISYFVFMAVILFEMFMYCSWNSQIQGAISDYRTKNNLHKKLSSKANKIGTQLSKRSLNEGDKYIKFMSQEKFRLHTKLDQSDKDSGQPRYQSLVRTQFLSNSVVQKKSVKKVK